VSVPMCPKNEERVIESVPDGTLVGVADPELRISLGSLSLSRMLGVATSLEGRNLRDVLADPESARRLAMVTCGVVTEAVLATHEDGWRLVGELASVGGQRWVLLHVRAPVVSTSSITTKRFVGREAELALFEDFVLGEADSLLFVEGSLGIGKTALLDAYEARCRALGWLCFRLDARVVDPSDSTILAALYPPDRGSSAVASLFPTARRLAGRRWVLLIDNFDAWMKFSALPKELFVDIRTDCRTVVAARRRSRSSWWGDTAPPRTTLSLGPLSSGDSFHMATMLGVDAKTRAREVGRAQGHPLCIAALTWTHRPSVDREAHALDPLASTALGGVSREILELAALPVRITEDLLAELLDDHALAVTVYDRLGEVCVRDPDGVGLRMPHSVREILVERLRRRNPMRFSNLQQRLAQYYAKRLDDGSTAYAPTIVHDLLDTLSQHPVLSRMYGGADSDGIMARRARSDEATALDAAIQRMADAETAADMMARVEAGNCSTYVLHQDDAIVAVLQFAVVTTNNVPSAHGGDRRRAAVKSVIGRFGEGTVHAATVLAFVIPPAELLGWGPVSRAVARLLFELFITARSTSASVVVSVPLRPSRSLPGAEIVMVDGLIVSMHDTRGATPQAVVSMLMNVTEEWLSPVFEPPPLVPVAITTEAVRTALANLDQLDQLTESPLASLELAPGATPAHQLQNLLRETLSTLEDAPSDQRLFLILRAVYVEKVGKHEQIAADLGLTYGTFRRHLSRALERVREVLTERVSRRGTVPAPR
jgi:hypothetical protein